MNIRHSTSTRTSPPDQFLACCSCQPVGLSLLLYSSRRHLLLLPAMAIPSPTWPSLASKNFWLALTVAKLSCRLFIQPPDSSVWRWWAARTATSLCTSWLASSSIPGFKTGGFQGMTFSHHSPLHQGLIKNIHTKNVIFFSFLFFLLLTKKYL